MSYWQHMNSKGQLTRFSCVFVPFLLIALNLGNHMDWGRVTHYSVIAKQTGSCTTLWMQVKDRADSSSQWFVEGVGQQWQTAWAGHLAQCRVTWRHSWKLPWRPSDGIARDHLLEHLREFAEIVGIRTSYRPPLLFWPGVVLLSWLMLKLGERRMPGPTSPSAT